jgi:hypothetical protein
MKFLTYITEIRRNPDINIKQKMQDILTTYLQKNTNNDYIMSLTEIDKLGVNPKYSWETPLGVYFYILNERNIKEILHNQTFGADRKYLWICQVDKSKVMNLDNYTHDDMERDRAILDEKYGFKEEIWNKLLDTRKHMYFNPARRMFYYTHLLAKTLPGKKVITWTNILQKDLGYQGVWDDGQGIIHSAEPSQFVAFTPKIYTVIDKISNTGIAPDVIFDFDSLIKVIVDIINNEKEIYDKIDEIIGCVLNNIGKCNRYANVDFRRFKRQVNKKRFENFIEKLKTAIPKVWLKQSVVDSCMQLVLLLPRNDMIDVLVDYNYPRIMEAIKRYKSNIALRKKSDDELLKIAVKENSILHWFDNDVIFDILDIIKKRLKNVSEEYSFSYLQYEIFENPSIKELNQCKSKFGTIRFCIDLKNKKLYVWNDNLLHYDVAAWATKMGIWEPNAYSQQYRVNNPYVFGCGAVVGGKIEYIHDDDETGMGMSSIDFDVLAKKIRKFGKIDWLKHWFTPDSWKEINYLNLS